MKINMLYLTASGKSWLYGIVATVFVKTEWASRTSAGCEAYGVRGALCMARSCSLAQGL